MMRGRSSTAPSGAQGSSQRAARVGRKPSPNPRTRQYARLRSTQARCAVAYACGRGVDDQSSGCRRDCTHAELVQDIAPVLELTVADLLSRTLENLSGVVETFTRTSRANSGGERRATPADVDSCCVLV